MEVLGFCFLTRKLARAVLQGEWPSKRVNSGFWPSLHFSQLLRLNLCFSTAFCLTLTFQPFSPSSFGLGAACYGGADVPCSARGDHAPGCFFTWGCA